MTILPVSGLANMGQQAPGNYLRFDEVVLAHELMGHVVKEIDVSAGGTITLVKGAGGNFIEGALFKLIGAPAGAFDLDVPDGDRRFGIWNTSGQIATVDSVGGSAATYPVADSAIRRFQLAGIELAIDGDFDIAGLDTGTVDGAADYFVAWDTSAGKFIKVLGNALLSGKQTTAWPVAAMQPTVTDGCGALTSIETIAGRPDQHVRDFSPTVEQHAQFSVPFPKSWNKGTVTFDAFYTHQGGQTAGLDGVAWSLQGVAIADDGPISVSYGTARVVTLDRATGDNIFVTAESAAITIAGAPGDNELTVFRVSRVVGDALDDLDIPAQLIAVRVFFTTDAGTDD